MSRSLAQQTMGIHWTVTPKANSQYRWDQENQESSQKTCYMKTATNSLLLGQAFKIEWGTDCKKGVANLYGNPQGEWVDHVAGYNTYKILSQCHCILHIIIYRFIFKLWVIVHMIMVQLSVWSQPSFMSRTLTHGY